MSNTFFAFLPLPKEEVKRQNAIILLDYRRNCCLLIDVRDTAQLCAHFTSGFEQCQFGHAQSHARARSKIARRTEGVFLCGVWKFIERKISFQRWVSDILSLNWQIVAIFFALWAFLSGFDGKRSMLWRPSQQRTGSLHFAVATTVAG